MMKGLILVVDDEPTQREAMADVLAQWGHETLTAGGVDEAVALLEDRPVDLALTDLRMPGGSGLDLLASCRSQRPDVAVVLMTAYGTVESAVDAMKQGAADFVTKPIDVDQLAVVVDRTLRMRHLLHENRQLRRRLSESSAETRLLGSSHAMADVLSQAARAAETDATVLIQGESGTGKELLARTVHDLSLRSSGPFVAVNCAALPETLLESEIFGHRRGSFTGADRDRPGRVQAAEGGTFFLDEIGDLAPPVQVKLLRFLQEREITPVGGDHPLAVDVRVVAATHRDLRARVTEGSFREDLFFRLNVVGLQLPPLRDRREDIPELASHFLNHYSGRYDRSARTFSAEAMASLVSHGYPGSVRELENVVEQTVVMTRGEVIHRDDLPTHLREAVAEGQAAISETGRLSAALEALEKRIVLNALAASDGNQSLAARELGITESGLRYKLAKWRDT